MKRLSPTAVYLVTTGLMSILGQVVILRELNVAYYGVELIYILALGFWFLGTAFGAAVGRRSGVPDERSIHTLLLCAAGTLAAEFVLVRSIRRILGAVPGGFLPFQTQLAGLALAVLPISFVTGLLFQFTSRKFASDGNSLAKAYALESAGGVLGGLLSTLFLFCGLQNISAELFCCAVILIVTAVYSREPGFDAQRKVSIAGLILIIPAGFFSRDLDRVMTSWNHPDLSATRDTPYGRVTVTSLDKQVNVFENDGLSYETGTTSAEELVQLSSIQRRLPKKVLVLGGGIAGIIDELLSLGVRKIDYVEVNGSVIEMLVKELPPKFGRSITDEKVSIVHDDPRRFLNTRRSYDAIMAAMPEPLAAQNNRFYTAEFFRQCSNSLNRDGVFSFALRSAENLWTPELVNRNGTIYAALKSAFENVVVIPGPTNIFLASDSTLTTDPAPLIEQFRSRAQATRLVNAEYIRYIYTNDRFATVNRALADEQSILNSDTRPACYSYTTSIWLSRFFSGYTLPDAGSVSIDAFVRHPVLWILSAVAVMLAVVKRLAAARKFLVVAIAGAAGMISETVVLLNYQGASGALYQDIGILLTTFMAGLTAGAAATDALMRKRHARGRKSSWFGAPLLAGTGLMNVFMLYGIKSGMLGGLVPASLALAVVGAFVSAIFAVASFHSVDARGRVMTWLYSADLVGGAFGSVAAILFLIPVLGLLSTCIAAAALTGFGMVFLK